MAPTGRPRGRGRGRGRAGAAATRGGRAAETTTNESEAGPADALGDATAQPAAPAEASNSTPKAGPTPAPTAASRGQSSTSSRGAPSIRARASITAGGSKFKPRAIRRGDAERERIAQEELEKQNLKVAEDQRLQRSRNFRGRRARGRGDAMGRGGGFDRRVSGGNSVFGNPGATGAGFKGESGFRSSSYRDLSNRLNTDMFNGPMAEPEDEEDEKKDGASSSRHTPRRRDIMPMGIPRREPEKKGLVVATTADMEAKVKAAAGEKTEEDIVMKDDGKIWPGASEGRKVKVRDADGKEVEVTEIDDRRLQRAHEEREERTRVAFEAEEEKKKPVAVKMYKNREEEVRAKQYSMLLDEFGPRPDSDAKDGRLYLFGFPPTLPPLRVVHRPKVVEKNPIKEEPIDDDNVVTMGVGETVDLTDKSGADGEEKPAEEQEDDEDPLQPYPDTVGFVGRMIVRKSGKVEMDWGGFPFKVMPGIQTNFITNAHLLEDADRKVKTGEIAGKAYGMGQIMGRFTVRPVFSDPEPPVIDPAEIAKVRAWAIQKEEEKAKMLEEKRLAREREEAGL